jgi:hypothetical protein
MDGFLERLLKLISQMRGHAGVGIEPLVRAILDAHLRAILEKRFGKVLDDVVFVRELAIRKSLIDAGVTNFSHFRVDHAAFSAANRWGLFIEFKSDIGSYSREQERMLHVAKTIGVHALLDGLCGLAERSRSRAKYAGQLASLEKAGFLARDAQLRMGPTELARESELDCVYIEPTPRNASNIGFAEIAATLRELKTQEAALIASYMDAWAQPPLTGVI